MKEYSVLILGGSGEVGREMLKILEERQFPVSSLDILASERSAGKRIKFRGEQIEIGLLEKKSFGHPDIILGALPSELSREYKNDILRTGGVYIDNSSAFRMDEDVPLVVPEINRSDVFRHKGIISNPNCSTIISLTAISPIVKKYGLESIYATTFQAVSGAGKKGIEDLFGGLDAYNRDVEYTPSVFPENIFFNLIPIIGKVGENGFTSEEMKMQNEGRKIFHLPELKVNCTCVRVPVVRSHSISLTIKTSRDVTVNEARECLMGGEGIVLIDDAINGEFPSPLKASDRDEVFVGRIRRDEIMGGISLFCSGDQIRKGAATNAVQIAECLTRAREII